MRPGLRQETGFTLIELLLSMTLFLIIISAALTSFNGFANGTKRSQDLTDAQVQARVALSRVARELRNLASPDVAHHDSVERAQDFDLVFRTINPVGPGTPANPTNLMRVRYCLDVSDPTNSTTLYRQAEVPSAGNGLREFQGSGDPLVASCPADPGAFNVPGATLQTTRVVAESVTNDRANAARPIFRYRPTGAVLPDISSISTTIFLDVNAADKVPAETNVTTSAFLRNQNRKPVAVIEPPTVTANNHVLLNGSGSVDPEGTPLDYEWTVMDGTTEVGSSENAFYDFSGDADKVYSITLVVTDGSNLPSDAVTACAATGDATC